MHPEHYPKYLQLSNELLHLRTAHSKLLGFWLTEIGGQNEAVHIWEYDSLTHRKAVRDALAKDKDWIEKYVNNVRGCWQFQMNSLIDLEIKEREAPQMTDNNEAAPNFYCLDFGNIETLRQAESDPALRAKFRELCGDKVGSVGQLVRSTSLDNLLRYVEEPAAAHSRIMFPAPWSKRLGCLWY